MLQAQQNILGTVVGTSAVAIGSWSWTIHTAKKTSSLNRTKGKGWNKHEQTICMINPNQKDNTETETRHKKDTYTTYITSLISPELHRCNKCQSGSATSVPWQGWPRVGRAESKWLICLTIVVIIHNYPITMFRRISWYIRTFMSGVKTSHLWIHKHQAAVDSGSLGVIRLPSCQIISANDPPLPWTRDQEPVQ